MAKKKTGSSPTAEENRRTARKTQIPGGKPGERFTGTKQARQGGMYLPTAEQKAVNKRQQEKVDLKSTRPQVPIQKRANEAIEREKRGDKGGSGRGGRRS